MTKEILLGYTAGNMHGTEPHVCLRLDVAEFRAFVFNLTLFRENVL